MLEGTLGIARAVFARSADGALQCHELFLRDCFGCDSRKVLVYFGKVGRFSIFRGMPQPQWFCLNFHGGSNRSAEVDRLSHFACVRERVLVKLLRWSWTCFEAPFGALLGWHLGSFQLHTCRFHAVDRKVSKKKHVGSGNTAGYTHMLHQVGKQERPSPWNTAHAVFTARIWKTRGWGMMTTEHGWFHLPIIQKKTRTLTQTTTRKLLSACLFHKITITQPWFAQLPVWWQLGSSFVGKRGQQKRNHIILHFLPMFLPNFNQSTAFGTAPWTCSVQGPCWHIDLPRNRRRFGAVCTRLVVALWCTSLSSVELGNSCESTKLVESAVWNVKLFDWQMLGEGRGWKIICFGCMFYHVRRRFWKAFQHAVICRNTVANNIPDFGPSRTNIGYDVFTMWYHPSILRTHGWHFKSFYESFATLQPVAANCGTCGMLGKRKKEAQGSCATLPLKLHCETQVLAPKAPDKTKVSKWKEQLQETMESMGPSIWTCFNHMWHMCVLQSLTMCCYHVFSWLLQKECQEEDDSDEGVTAEDMEEWRKREEIERKEREAREAEETKKRRQAERAEKERLEKERKEREERKERREKSSSTSSRRSSSYSSRRKSRSKSQRKSGWDVADSNLLAANQPLGDVPQLPESKAVVPPVLLPTPATVPAPPPPVARMPSFDARVPQPQVPQPQVPQPPSMLNAPNTPVHMTQVMNHFPTGYDQGQQLNERTQVMHGQVQPAMHPQMQQMQMHPMQQNLQHPMQQPVHQQMHQPMHQHLQQPMHQHQQPMHQQMHQPVQQMHQPMHQHMQPIQPMMQPQMLQNFPIQSAWGAGCSWPGGWSPDVARPGGLSDERFIGRIKRYQDGPLGGYGFIDCDEIKTRFSRDVYIHKNQMVGFQIGDEVSFTISLNNKGEPQARNVMKSEEALMLRAGGLSGAEVDPNLMDEHQARQFQAILRDGSYRWDPKKKVGESAADSLKHNLKHVDFSTCFVDAQAWTLQPALAQWSWPGHIAHLKTGWPGIGWRSQDISR